MTELTSTLSKRPHPLAPLSTFHSPLSTRRIRGMSLMEVLASTFVIGIGLIGVLAVIPFGAYQVSKARDAEHCSNMLNAAAAEIRLAEMAKPTSWVTTTDDTNWLTSNITYNDIDLTDEANDSKTNIFLNHSTQASKRLSCSRFFMVDPFDTGSRTLGPHIFRIGGYFNPRSLWEERMRGQDDLIYTTHPDRRTDFSGQNNKVLSSGKYSWFFTFRPNTTASNKTNVVYADWPNTETVDILGCYNRIPGEERTLVAQAHRTAAADFESYLNGGAKIRLRGQSESGMDLSKTKYLFISWSIFDGSSTDIAYSDGCWCKIVNAGKTIAEDYTVTNHETGQPSNVSTKYRRDVFVTGSLPSGFTPPNGKDEIMLRALAIDGVLYHKRLDGPNAVPIK